MENFISRFPSLNTSSSLILSGLSTSDKSLRDRLREELRGILEAFDAILVEECGPDHKRITILSDNPQTSRLPSPSPSNASSATLIMGEKDDGITCDFCAADIFQGFFECRSCVEGAPGRENLRGDSCDICPGCYIEGRTCRCGSMDPVQCRPFEDLLRDRRRAVEAYYWPGQRSEDQKRNAEKSVPNWLSPYLSC